MRTGALLHWRRTASRSHHAPLAFLLLFRPGIALPQAKVTEVFLLEDARNKQWCFYTIESTWKAQAQAVGAMTVGTLTYSNNNLSEIDLTHTDESGDWTVYDHYFFDDHGQLVRLSRLVNVLPGDRSVSQTFSISNGKATKTATSEKQLSTGKPVTVPAADWLPDLPVETATKMFPFAALLEHSNLRTASKLCVPVSGR